MSEIETLFHAVWWVALVLTIALGVALNSMVVLAVMVVPLIALHLWLALKEPCT